MHLVQKGRHKSGQSGFWPEAKRRLAGHNLQPGQVIGLLFVLIVLASWEGLVWLAEIPHYLLPGPFAILRVLRTNLQPLLLAGATTLAEALIGLIVGTGLGLALAILLNFRVKLEQGVMALAILVKSTPIIAIAPILTIWLGFGPAPKIVITALLTFFPVLVNALSGFRAADKAILDVMHSLDASPGEIFVYVRWPGARPYLFAALKVVTPLSMIGAVVAEWMGASAGLGRQMWLAYSNINMPALFAAVFVLALLSTALYQGVLLLEKKFLFWS